MRVRSRRDRGPGAGAPRPGRPLLVLLLSAAPAAPGCAAPATRPAPAPRPREAVGLKALDGDSIQVRLAGGATETVRLLSVDAPEHGQPLAQEARAFTDRLVTGARLDLEPGVEPRDRYGRLLALVWTGDTLVNAALVEAGLAVAYIRPPNEAHADSILLAQATAHARSRGLWGPGGPYEEPRSYRERMRSEAQGAPAPPPRPLRFEAWTLVANRHTRLVHWPGCRHVDSIRPENRLPLATVAEAMRRQYRLERGYR